MTPDIDPGLVAATRAFLDDPDARADPEELFRRLPTEAPVVPIGDGRVVVGGYQAIRHALRAPEVGTGVVPGRWGAEAAGGRDDALGRMARAFINEVDGEAHEHISQAMQVSWIVDPPSLVDEWAAEVVDGALAGMGPDGTLDLVATVFRPLPAVVICRACDLDEADLALIRRWAADLGALPMPASMQPPGWEDAAVAAAEALMSYLADLVEHRRTGAGRDFLSLVVERAGDTITDDQLMALMAGITVGGQEGVTATMASAMSQFLAMDGFVDRLRADPDVVDRAVWEAQRIDGAHRFTLRYALEDLAIEGVDVAQGDLVMAFLAAGNRDPVAFPDPEAFDVDRTSHHRGHGRNLAHSFGEHHCGGTALGHAMVNAALRRLLERTSSIEAVGDPSAPRPHTGNLLFAMITELPVRVTLA